MFPAFEWSKGEEVGTDWVGYMPVQEKLLYLTGSAAEGVKNMRRCCQQSRIQIRRADPGKEKGDPPVRRSP
jgi:hypothetical protein